MINLLFLYALKVPLLTPTPLEVVTAKKRQFSKLIREVERLFLISKLIVFYLKHVTMTCATT